MHLALPLSWHLLQVVYEDSHMACVRKPAGMPSQEVGAAIGSHCSIKTAAQEAEAACSGATAPDWPAVPLHCSKCLTGIKGCCQGPILGRFLLPAAQVGTIRSYVQLTSARNHLQGVKGRPDAHKCLPYVLKPSTKPGVLFRPQHVSRAECGG